MSKNIVILFDGTSNEISENRTNILRLFGALERTDEQIVLYDPGVGTFGAENAVSYYYRKGVEVWGLASGWGLDRNVKEAYKFLVETYKGTSDGQEKADKIFLFGFSRGAYTARVFAGFLHEMGLIDHANLNLLNYVYRSYKAIGYASDDLNGAKFKEARLHQRVLRPRRPEITFMGLFDTVGSIIENGRYGPRIRSHAWVDQNRSVQAVRHAVALDERRTMFLPQLWPAGQKFRPKYWQEDSEEEQDAKEVWFSGHHGDVGGGMTESKSALAKIPLAWMIEQAVPFGLKIKTRTLNTVVLAKSQTTTSNYLAPDAQAPVNSAMKNLWPVLEFFPRMKQRFLKTKRWSLFGWYIPFFERRAIPDGAIIYQGALDRQEDHPNIPDNHKSEPLISS